MIVCCMSFCSSYCWFEITNDSLRTRYAISVQCIQYNYIALWNIIFYSYVPTRGRNIHMTDVLTVLLSIHSWKSWNWHNNTQSKIRFLFPEEFKHWQQSAQHWNSADSSDNRRRVGFHIPWSIGRMMGLLQMLQRGAGKAPSFSIWCVIAKTTARS